MRSKAALYQDETVIQTLDAFLKAKHSELNS
jgi:hypothetical protein